MSNMNEKLKRWYNNYIGFFQRHMVLTVTLAVFFVALGIKYKKDDPFYLIPRAVAEDIADEFRQHQTIDISDTPEISMQHTM